MDKNLDFSVISPGLDSSRLVQESEFLLARLPPPEPLNAFTSDQLLAAKRSLQGNIDRHSKQFPELKDSIGTAGDALIDGDLSALQRVIGKPGFEAIPCQILAQELDRDLTLLGVRVTLGRHGDQASLDILRVGDSKYLSVPLSQSQAPCIRGPVAYSQGEDFSLGDDVSGGSSAAQKQLDRIRQTIIAWQAF